MSINGRHDDMGRRTGRARAWLALLATAAVAASVPALASADAASAAAANPALLAMQGSARPRIGLVLGGGGAKGAAHVGVITLLEDMRIPVDCVVGTSMGALVGGTYAAGMTAAEVEQAIGRISWAQTIGFEGRREKLPMRRKLAGRTYSNTLEFGFRDGGIAPPRGFVNTQNIEQTIRDLVARSLGTSDFDELPIPFRAIATDMMTGEMVVLDHGDLAQAMRASMAVPGIFSPVTIEGRTLGDGGLMRNVPVDIARQTCADVVIAVAVPTPPPPAEDLLSPITMISRSLDVLIGANEKAQLDTLGPDDVKIIVPMGDIGSASFDRVAQAIPVGRSAAEQQRAALRRYSLPAAEYAAWRESARRPGGRRVVLADVQVTGLQRVDEAYVRSYLGLAAGQEVDERQLSKAVNRLFDLDDFESVQYSMSGDPARPSLRVEVTENSLAPNILRFDLGVSIGTEGANAFVMSGDYLRPWINSRGGEVHGQLQLGRTSLAQLSLYQPMDAAHQWFLEPGARIARSTEDLYIDDDAAARYDYDSGFVYLDAGRVFGTRAELRLGLRTGFQSATSEIAFPGLPDIDPEGYGGYSLGYTYDNRDRDVLATRGWLSRIQYFRGSEALGSERDYDRLEGLVLRAMPFRNDVVQVRVAGGATFDGALPFYDYFQLGGPISFPGLSLGQLRGTSYWTAGGRYMHKVADISALFGQAFYLGTEIFAGDMSGRPDDMREPILVGGSLVLGGRTPLGPVSFSLATTSSEDWSILFSLGRPIDEGSITDANW